MLDLDTWQEIVDTIRANKLRSFLTGFSVAWGIFMLIVLLGSGVGLGHGVEYQFRDDAVNSIWVFPGQTSVPYKGLQPGRRVQLTNDDHDEVATGVLGVEHISSRYFIRGSVQVRYRNETSTFNVRAVHPDHLYLEKTIVVDGRFLNPLDVRDHRKVAVIGTKVKDALFKAEPPVGKLIEVNGVAFQVVGVFSDEGGDGARRRSAVSRSERFLLLPKTRSCATRLPGSLDKRRKEESAQRSGPARASAAPSPDCLQSAVRECAALAIALFLASLREPGTPEHTFPVNRPAGSSKSGGLAPRSGLTSNRLARRTLSGKPLPCNNLPWSQIRADLRAQPPHRRARDLVRPPFVSPRSSAALRRLTRCTHYNRSYNV